MNKCFCLTLIGLLAVISCQFGQSPIDYSQIECEKTAENTNTWVFPGTKEENCFFRILIKETNNVKNRCCWVKYQGEDAETKTYTCEEILYDATTIENREKALKDAKNKNVDIQCSSSYLAVLFSYIILFLF